MNNLISIIVPFYNTEKYISACIESILSQDYKDIEVILVNDGSSDKSLELCKQFQDSRIIIIDKPNGGVSSARNKGLDVAKGEYITFVDSDDIIPSSAITTLYNAETESLSDMILGSSKFLFGDKLQPHSMRLSPCTYQFKDLLSRFIDDGMLSGFLVGNAHAVLYKKSIIESYGLRFNEKIRFNEDGLFNFEYAIHATDINVINDCVYYCRRGIESSCSRRPKTDMYNKNILEYISNLVWDKDNNDFDIQAKRRYVSTAMWDILLYPRALNYKEGCNFIKAQISTKEFLEGSEYIQKEKLSKYKKLFFILMQNKMSGSLFFLVKYILPLLNNKVAR